ncbi:MAG: 50S ribosomal protein L5 [Deltaproteobacteria bacterium]|nr:MAG: 50S ribosomal protein L5 [Deltaproteobacteria bacterium]
MARLKEKYTKEIVPALVEKFGYTNPMLVPKIEKIAINIGAGDAREDAKLMDKLADELTQITGQKPVVTRAKRSIANFHLREGMPVGCRVTLRHERMYEFLDRLISVALPRVRDFNGVSAKAFDGRGNYTLGVSEQIIFPEIDLEKVDKIKGMNVTIVTSAKTDEECKVLLASFGMPFKR